MKKTWTMLVVLVLLLTCTLSAMAAKAPQDMVIEENVLVAYNGDEQHVEVPQGVTEIGAYAFYGRQNLKSVVLPDSVTTISDCAFGNCRALETIDLGKGLKHIGTSAFYNCRALNTPVLPAGLEYMGNECFAYCSTINKIVVPEGVTHIGDRLFASCTSMKQCTMPGSLVILGVDLLEGSPCQYVVVTSNDNVKSFFAERGFVAGSQEEIDLAKAKAEGRVRKRPDLAEQTFDLWIEAADASTQMSSSDGSVIYYGFMTVDIDDTTAWQFKTNAAHSLSDIYLDIKLRDPSAVNGLKIKAGHWGTNRSGEELYRQKGRPTRVELSFCYKGSKKFVDPVVLDIPDKKGDDYHVLNFDWRMNVTKIRMRILKVATGDKFGRDVAISELRATGLDMSQVPVEIVPEGE